MGVSSSSIGAAGVFTLRDGAFAPSLSSRTLGRGDLAALFSPAWAHLHWLQVKQILLDSPPRSLSPWQLKDMSWWPSHSCCSAAHPCWCLSLGLQCPGTDQVSPESLYFPWEVPVMCIHTGRVSDLWVCVLTVISLTLLGGDTYLPSWNSIISGKRAGFLAACITG